MGFALDGPYLKLIVFFFNAIVFIGGTMIFGFGIYLVIKSSKSTITQTIGVLSFVLAVGLLVFLLGFLGCIGACTDNVCMLKSGCGEALHNVLKDKTLAMVIILVLLAFLEIGAIVAACVLAGKISSCS